MSIASVITIECSNFTNTEDGTCVESCDSNLYTDLIKRECVSECDQSETNFIVWVDLDEK